MSSIPEDNTPAAKKIVEPYITPHKSKMWMWTGVIIFMVAIFALWGMNLITLFYESSQVQDPAKEMLNTSKNDLQAIIKTFAGQEIDIEEELTDAPTAPTTTISQEQKIQQALSETLLPLFVSSTTNTESNSNTTTIQ